MNSGQASAQFAMDSSMSSMRTSPLSRLLNQSKAWLVVAILSAAFIGYKSLEPSLGLPSVPHIDKVMHFIAYAGLGALFMLGLANMRQVWVCAGAIIYGAMLEGLQFFMHLGRTASWLDFMANSFGAIIGTSLAMWALTKWVTR